METNIPESRLPAAVNVQALAERKLAEAELSSIDTQIGNFDRLSARAEGKSTKPDLVYQSLVLRRETVLEKVRKLSVPPEKVGPVFLPPIRPGGTLVDLPIAPIRFIDRFPWFGFGTSGFVQAGQAADNVNVIPQAPYPISGSIETTSLSNEGGVFFDGDLNVGPDEIAPNKYSPEIRYFWLRNWIFLVPFPAPAMASLFSYRFDVSVFLSLFCEGGLGTFMSFVSVGETPNFQPGQEIVVNHDAGWPMNADLSVPNSTTGAYNGRYGYLTGSTTVQRSFHVQGGHVPAVAVVIGAVAGLPMMEHLRLDFPSLGNSAISLSQGGQVGRISYHTTPDLVIAV